MVSIIFSSQSNESSLRRFVLAWLGVLVFVFIFFLECKVYDPSTALLFAFGLGLMARGKWDVYFAVFAFACVNRETSFLLAMVFAMYGLVDKWIGGWKAWALAVGYQVFLFAAIRVCLVTIFADNPGVMMLVRPGENVRGFMELPVLCIVHWGSFAALFWMGLRRWAFAPQLVKVALMVMIPTLMVLYVVLGWSYEVRVFAEVFPVVWWMMVGGPGRH
jgi:hypothetical protein